MGVCVLGSINLDVVHRVERLPRPGETVLGLGIARFLGGKGANQAIAAARMGADARLIGAVGEDLDGQALVEQLALDGVEVSAVRRVAGTATGAAHICVAADGENMIVVTPGANAAMAPAMAAAAIRPDDRVFLGQLETPVAALRALYESAAARAGLKLLNAAPALPEGAALFALVDLLIVNETELAAYAGLDAAPIGADDVAAAARPLAAENGITVIVTLGAAGAMAVSAQEVLIVPGRRASAVVDTTGAGDCFCGALAAALGSGLALGESLAAANAAACLSVGRSGAGPSMPRRAEVEALLRADARAGA